MERIVIPYVSIEKSEIILSSEPWVIEDKGTYILISHFSKLEKEEEDDMGIKDIVRKKYDSTKYIPKHLAAVEIFYDNSTKKFVLNVDYNVGGVSIGFPNKEIAEATAEKVINMLTNKN